MPVLEDHPLADRGDGVVGQPDEVEPIGDQHRVREGLADGPGV